MGNTIFISGETQPFKELQPFTDCIRIKEISKESISYLVREDAHGLMLDHHPTHEDVKLLGETLGRSFQPTGFPVFVDTTSCDSDLGMETNPWIEFAPANDKLLFLKMTQRYNLIKEVTHRWLTWGTLFAFVVLFYLVLKGAGLWLPWNSLELRVAKFLEQDDPRAEVRLAGTLEGLVARKTNLESLANGVELALLPSDLSYVLTSRKRECDRYILLYRELTSQPSHQSFKQTGELEVFLKYWRLIESKFPESWHKTSAYFYWQNRLKDAEEYQSSFLRFCALYQNRREQLQKFFKLDGLQPENKTFLEDWMDNTQKVLNEPWWNEDAFLSQSQLSVVLEMRLYIHQLQKDLIQFMEWGQYFHALQIRSSKQDSKPAFKEPTFNQKIWSSFSKEQQALLKDLAQPLLTKLPELKKTDHDKANQLELFQKLLENQAIK